MKNYSIIKYPNDIYSFRSYRYDNIGIIHKYYIYDQTNKGLTCITRILTKHPIIWNRYRTKYTIIRKIKGYYVLENIEMLSLETIKQIHDIYEFIVINKLNK